MFSSLAHNRSIVSSPLTTAPRLRHAVRWGCCAALVVCAAAVAPLAPAAASIIPEDSSLFNHNSEMNTGGDLSASGSTTNWSPAGGGSSSLSGTGLLNVDTSASLGTSRYWVSNLWNAAVSPATGWTIEFSVRIDSSTTGDSFNRALMIIAGDDGTNGGSVQLQIGTNNTYIASFPDPITIDSNSNTDGFHVFRIAKDANSTVFQVWRDGVQIGVNVASGGADREMYFADGTGSFSGAGAYDYLRWDATGAFSPPVPEPASLTLLVLGGALALRRRR